MTWLALTSAQFAGIAAFDPSFRHLRQGRLQETEQSRRVVRPCRTLVPGFDPKPLTVFETGEVTFTLHVFLGFGDRPHRLRAVFQDIVKGRLWMQLAFIFRFSEPALAYERRHPRTGGSDDDLTRALLCIGCQVGALPIREKLAQEVAGPRQRIRRVDTQLAIESALADRRRD